MSSSFEDEIKNLAGKFKDNSNDSLNQEADKNPDLAQVFKEFLSVSKKGTDIFNKAQNGEVLKVYELPPDFLEIFLGIPGRQGGLSVVSDNKIAIFFDEVPGLITAIGKIRNDKRGIKPNLNNSLKLLQLSYYKSEKGFQYKDNTGSSLSCENAVTVILGWLVS